MKNLIFVLFTFLLLGCSSKKPYFLKNENEGDWNLVWSEDFDNSTEFDEHWNSENSSPSHILSSRWRENVSIENGQMFLHNRKESKGGKEWTSGSVTYKKSVGYGYLECRMKISAAPGINNSFWLYNWSREHHHSFEIDIVEAQYPSIIRTNIHDNGYKDNKNKSQSSKKIENNLNLSEDFHVYGLEWTPKQLKYYFDGRLVRVEENKVCKSTAKLVLGSAVLNWAGTVTDSIDGTEMVVDYVRYFKLKE